MSLTEPNVRVSDTLNLEAARAPVLPEPGEVLSGHRIVEKLTSGGFGTVFLADNLGLPGQHTVVKCMPLGQLSEREADVLRHIDHPTVVKVLALGKTDQFQYIVMEYLRGETLDALLGKYHQLGPIQAVRIALRIADALEAVHEKGLVHRDLKPANIMLKLAKDHGKFVDWLKLIDFGLARDHGHQLTIAEGTPEYVAPETLQQQPVTPSSDLYALGVIMHEMLTGQRPYQASSVTVMVSQHVNAAVPHVRDLAADVSVELDQLVYELMSKEPSLRPSSASEVAKRLSRLERELSDGSTGVAMVALGGDRAPDSASGPTQVMATPMFSGTPSVVVSTRPPAEPTPLLLPLRMQASRWPWPAAMLAVLGLLAAVFWVSMSRGSATAVAAPPVVAPVAVVKPEPVMALPPLEIVESSPPKDDELAAPVTIAMKKPLPSAKKTKLASELDEEGEVVDERWRNNAALTLRDAAKFAKDSAKKQEIYEQADREVIGPLIRSAKTPADCVDVTKKLTDLKVKLGIP